MLLWENVMSAAFLVVTSVIIWGALQGWFSKRIHPKPGPEPVLVKDNQDLKDRIAKLEARIFELENELAAKNALIAQLNATIQRLMDDIARLTTDLAKCQENEAKLAAALKIALEELQACRAALAKCKAELLAKQVQNAVCKLQPENANLLR